MLSQLQRLSIEADGRYANDTELEFLQNYAQSLPLRLEAYQKLQAAERDILQQVYAEMRSLQPDLFMGSSGDLTGKWRRDTIRVFRYSAITLLLDDVHLLRDRLLYWMQTLMRAFGAQRSCELTYKVMQNVVRQYLTAAEADLFCAILELNRLILGST